MMKVLFHVSITLLDLHVAFCAQKDYHYQKAQSRWGKFPRITKLPFESCIIYLVASPRCTCQKRKACCEFTKLACN